MAKANQPATAKWQKWACGYPAAAVLLVVHFFVAATAVLEKSNTYDEVAYVTAGYSYWTENDYRLNPENGVLPQRWFALPLLTMKLHLPKDTNPTAWEGADIWTFGKDFFFTSGNDADALLWRARCMNILLSVGLGTLVYFWSRRLFGPAGGILSLLLYVTDPTVLANGSMATADIAAAAFFAASAGCVWMMCQKVSPATVLLGWLALSCLALSKTSGVLILPISAVLLAIRLWDGRPLQVAWWKKERTVEQRLSQAGVLLSVVMLETVLVIATIWANYGFRYSAFQEPHNGQERFLYTWEEVLSDPGVGTKTLAFARDHRLLPEAFLMGSANAVHFAQKRAAFLNGQYSTTGWHYFFPYTFLVKTPLCVFPLIALAFAGAIWSWRPVHTLKKGTGSERITPNAAKKGGHETPVPFFQPSSTLTRAFYATAPLWVLLAVYWIVAIQSHLNIGHRHLMPVYPATFILLGAAAHWFDRKDRAGRIAAWGVLLCGAAAVADCMMIYPHYLAYFNAIAGGPRSGYKRLVDSSLDIGQDLPGLKRWLREHGLDGQKQVPVYLAYVATSSPEHYQIQAENLCTFMEPLTPGVYCISATYLQHVYTPPPGHWRLAYEKTYQEVLAAVRTLENAPDQAAYDQLIKAKGEAYWSKTLADYVNCRAGRLCAYLRSREPDDTIGYSILIYRLTAQDLQKALYDKPVELEAEPAPLP